MVMSYRKGQNQWVRRKIVINTSCIVDCHYHESYVAYDESIKRKLKTRPIYECRCDERLKTKAEEFVRYLRNLRVSLFLVPAGFLCDFYSLL